MSAATESNTTQSLTAPAPLEPFAANEQPYNFMVIADVEVTNYADTVANLVSDYLEGCGNVDLVKIDATMLFSKASEFVYIGFSDANGSKGAKTYAMRPDGYAYKAGVNIPGSAVVVELLPPNIYSRQLQPVSSLLPTLKIHIAKSETVDMQMRLYVKIHGPRMIYTTWSNSSTSAKEQDSEGSDIAEQADTPLEEDSTTLLATNPLATITIAGQKVVVVENETYHIACTDAHWAYYSGFCLRGLLYRLDETGSTALNPKQASLITRFLVLELNGTEPSFSYNFVSNV